MENLKNLKILEQEGLVKVYETKEGNKVVDGRELWEGLGVKKEFASWIKNNLENVDAVENVDFTSFVFKEKAPNTYITTKEYILKLGIAKEICMVAGANPRANEELKKKSKEYRKYLISIEEKYKQNNNVIQFTGIEPQVLQLAQGMQIIGSVVQSMQKAVIQTQEFVKDSIRAKDYQIEQIADMVGFRAKHTIDLTITLKDRLTKLIGEDVDGNSPLYKKIKRKVFKEFKVFKWEDIPVEKYNSVFAYIDTLEKEDL